LDQFYIYLGEYQLPEYQAPTREMNFIYNEIIDIQSHYAKLKGCEEVSPDLIQAILEEAGKFASQVLQPLNTPGDEEGCHWEDGVVTTPKGFKQAYKQFREAGWTSLGFPQQFGGQGLPYSLNLSVAEMISASNSSWGMYNGLTAGAIHAILAHGSDQQKQTYLNKMIAGEWTGTMCLTEAHCGTDLGMLRTKAEPLANGGYRITGSKIFISSGDHDLSNNIVHLVLARLPDAPQGTKGISLFIVPKYQVDQEGEAGDANGVSCGSIEHKMGINGSTTCVINFDNAEGYLIGPENKGLHCMFTMMNVARLGTGLQGLAIGEASLQGAISYAKDRIQGRALSGPKSLDKAADEIIVHPDVRRMLLTMKAFTEANRAIALHTATLVDLVDRSDDEEVKAQAELELGFLTPICKAFFTETGFEVTNHGVQVLGGHGYIKEWGMEQLIRDSRITLIYEGTNGIQSLDLLGRKVLGDQGAALKAIIGQIIPVVTALPETFAQSQAALQKGLKDWGDMAMSIGSKAMQNPDEVGAAAFDFLMYSGYMCAAWQWAKMVNVSTAKIASGGDSDGFYQAKLQTAKFYFERILPRIRTHKACIHSGAENLMAMDEGSF